MFLKYTFLWRNIGLILKLHKSLFIYSFFPIILAVVVSNSPQTLSGLAAQTVDLQFIRVLHNCIQIPQVATNNEKKIFDISLSLCSGSGSSAPFIYITRICTLDLGWKGAGVNEMWLSSRHSANEERLGLQHLELTSINVTETVCLNSASPIWTAACTNLNVLEVETLLNKSFKLRGFGL